MLGGWRGEGRSIEWLTMWNGCCARLHVHTHTVFDGYYDSIIGRRGLQTAIEILLELRLYLGFGLIILRDSDSRKSMATSSLARLVPT